MAEFKSLEDINKALESGERLTPERVQQAMKILDDEEHKLLVKPLTPTEIAGAAVAGVGKALDYPAAVSRGLLAAGAQALKPEKKIFRKEEFLKALSPLSTSVYPGTGEILQRAGVQDPGLLGFVGDIMLDPLNIASIKAASRAAQLRKIPSITKREAIPKAELLRGGYAIPRAEGEEVLSQMVERPRMPGGPTVYQGPPTQQGLLTTPPPFKPKQIPPGGQPKLIEGPQPTFIMGEGSPLESPRTGFILKDDRSLIPLEKGGPFYEETGLTKSAGRDVIPGKMPTGETSLTRGVEPPPKFGFEPVKKVDFSDLDFEKPPEVSPEIPEAEGRSFLDKLKEYVQKNAKKVPELAVTLPATFPSKTLAKMGESSLAQGIQDLRRPFRDLGVDPLETFKRHGISGTGAAIREQVRELYPQVSSKVGEIFEAADNAGASINMDEIKLDLFKDIQKLVTRKSAAPKTARKVFIDLLDKLPQDSIVSASEAGNINQIVGGLVSDQAWKDLGDPKLRDQVTKNLGGKIKKQIENAILQTTDRNTLKAFQIYNHDLSVFNNKDFQRALSTAATATEKKPLLKPLDIAVLVGSGMTGYGTRVGVPYILATRLLDLSKTKVVRTKGGKIALKTAEGILTGPALDAFIRRGLINISKEVAPKERKNAK